MIGRVLWESWIFARAFNLLRRGVTLPAPSLENRLEKALHHLKILIGYKGGRTGER